MLVLATRSLLLRAGYGRSVCDLAAVLAVVTGPLALYGTRATHLSHLFSALFAALVVLALVRWIEDPSVARSLLLGAAAGGLVVTRWQDALILGCFGLGVLSVFRSLGRKHWRTLPLSLVPFALAVSCQLRAWQVQFGHLFLIPQGPNYMTWSSPHLAGLLLSTYHGLLPWMPLFALGLGAATFARSTGSAWDKIRRVAFPLTIVVAIWASASVADWWGGASFGPRRLSTLTVIAAFGLAWVLDRWSIRGRLLFAAVAFVWAGFILTAQLSGFDDLRVPLQGRVDPWNPYTLADYDRARWINDGYLIPYIVRPGFILWDDQTPRRRLVGAAVVFITCALAVFIWRLAGRSQRSEAALAAFALGWLVLASGWLFLGVPSNAEANRLWRDIVIKGVDPTVPLPYRLDGPAHLIAADRAIVRGDLEAFEQFVKGIGPTGPTREELLRIHRSPAERDSDH